MAETERKKAASSKVVQAITPGMKAAQSITGGEQTSSKKIVINKNSSRISQEVKLERSERLAASTELAAAMREREAKLAERPSAPETTPAGESTESKSSKLGIIIGATVVFVGVLVAAIVLNNGADDPAPAANPAAAAPATSPTTTPAAVAPIAPTTPKETLPLALEAGLLAHWPFDGNLEEATEQQGKSKKDKTPEFVDGPRGQAIRLDGTSPVIIPQLNLDLKQISDRFTIASWVRIPAGKPQARFAGIVTRGEPFYRLSINGHNEKQFHFGMGRWAPGEKTGRVNTPIEDYPADTWYHLCGIRNGRNITLYVDGKKVGETKNVQTVFDASRDFAVQIGGNASFKHTNDNHRNLTGDVDDVRIYGRPLNEREIRELAKKL